MCHSGAQTGSRFLYIGSSSSSSTRDPSTAAAAQESAESLTVNPSSASHEPLKVTERPGNVLQADSALLAGC